MAIRMPSVKHSFKPFYVASSYLASISDYDLMGSLVGDKANSVVFDNTKLKRAVPGFIPDISFKEGIRETVAFIMSHPELQTEDPEFDAWCDKVIDVLEKAQAEFSK